MKVLKSRKFSSHEKLVIFVNDNNILQENIIAVNCAAYGSGSDYVVFFYGDSEITEEVRGFWD